MAVTDAVNRGKPGTELRCRIADLKVLLRASGKVTLAHAERYKAKFTGPPDITVDVKREIIERYMRKLNCSYEVSEYLCTGTMFNRHALKFGGFMLHASAIRYKEKAYLFSGECGIGKSTHTALWKKYLGDAVTYINDDKPFLRRDGNGVFSACGTPWSGKSDLSENIKAPVKAVCFIAHSERPYIKKLGVAAAFGNINAQTSHPGDGKQADILLELITDFIRKIPVYVLGCETGKKSFKLAYNALTG